jgi:hypothetical protein
VGGLRLLERQHGRDLDRHRARGQHRGDRLEATRSHVDQKEPRFDPAPLGKRRIGRRHCGNEPPAGFQDIERARLRLAADEVEHRVDILRAAFEAFGPIVDHCLRPERHDESRVARLRGRDDLDPGPAGELHGECADAAGRAMNDDRFAARELRSSNRACQAVTATTGLAAAATSERRSGFAASLRASAIAVSA